MQPATNDSGTPKPVSRRAQFGFRLFLFVASVVIAVEISTGIITTAFGLTSIQDPNDGAKKKVATSSAVAPIKLVFNTPTAIDSDRAPEGERQLAGVEPVSNDSINQLMTLSLRDRGALLKRLSEKGLTRTDITTFALDFSRLTKDALQSTDMADYLTVVFEVSQKHGLLDAELARTFGRLFAGDSFDPNGKGFGKESRGSFEQCLTMASAEQKEFLEAGLRESFEDQIAKAKVCTPRESVRKLVGAMTSWGDERFAHTADCFFGTEYASSWNLAVKHLGVLFLLKAREVSPEANSLSHQMVTYWLKNLTDGKKLTPIKSIPQKADDGDVLKSVLIEIGRADILEKLAERSIRPENRESNGVVNSPPIIYAHQYRNLILKEIRRGFRLSENEKTFIESELNKNESELTDMLRQYQAEEGTTDGLSGYNTYAVATTVLTSREPSLAYEAMLAARDQEFAPYYVDSKFKASPRGGCGRTIPFRLAEMVHGRSEQEITTARNRLAKAVINYMDNLPDLLYHARGRYWHRGEDQIAPYFFHPTVPFEAAALRILSNEESFTEMERTHFRYLKDRLQRDIIACQKTDGTFMLPDTVGDPAAKKEENGGYYSAAAWVNPLTGLALLCLIDDASEPHTQFGILNPESFQPNQ